jgi:hypothetical protein
MKDLIEEMRDGARGKVLRAFQLHDEGDVAAIFNRAWQEATTAALAIVEGRLKAMEEALEPFANYHGDLPDYDNPLRPCYDSGIQYAVELLAKTLGVEDWEICDGTEEFDGDLAGTLLNIVTKTWPTDEHGDWLDLRNPEARAALTPTEEKQS